MKRELKPFVVEVKRGKRRLPLGGIVDAAKEQVSEAGRRADRALFASAPEQQTASPMRGGETTGRILPSLIEAKLPADPRHDEPRRRGRKPGSKNKPKVRHLEGIPLSVGQTGAGRVAGRIPRPAEADSAAGSRPVSTSSAVEQASPSLATLGSGHSQGPVPRAGRIRLRDRSAILARYVFETAPAPGERWKRPSRRKAARSGKYRLSM